jgi:hypothetical protein
MVHKVSHDIIVEDAAGQLLCRDTRIGVRSAREAAERLMTSTPRACRVSITSNLTGAILGVWVRLGGDWRRSFDSPYGLRPHGDPAGELKRPPERYDKGVSGGSE